MSSVSLIIIGLIATWAIKIPKKKESDNGILILACRHAPTIARPDANLIATSQRTKLKFQTIAYLL